MESIQPKVTDGLMRALQQAPSDQPISVIVRYSASRRMMRHREHIAGVRESYLYRLRPFAHLRATPEAIERLALDPEVVRIYEDVPVRAFLDTALPHVGVPLLWDNGLTGEGVAIAIVDTGLDAEHPDFAGRVADMADFSGEGLGDAHGHGTHCAGIAAGSGVASGGRYRGVAPKATLYSAKVLRANGEGMMSDVIAGVEWAVEKGVQVISLSLGSTGPSDGRDPLSETCDAAVERGINVVVAAGNDGPAPRTIGSPGASRLALTIGACDDQDRVASFSSRGPTADGRQKPDLVVPGVDIIAPRAKGTAMGRVVDDYYTSAQGTSMATPLAAGVVALLLQAYPSLTPQEIRDRLLSSALDLGDGPYVQGYGRLDAWRAYQSEPSPKPVEPPQPPPSSGPALGEGCLTVLLQMLFSGKGRTR